MQSGPDTDSLFRFDIDSLRRLFAQNGFEFLEEKEEEGVLSVWARHKRTQRRKEQEEKPKEVKDDAADITGRLDSDSLRPGEQGDQDDGASGL